MSLNRAVVALGAVAVVGVATLGFSIPFAAHKGQPVPNISVVAGSRWTQIPPKSDCYHGGKVLTTQQLAACSKAIQAQLVSNALPSLPVNAAGTFAINVDQIVADKGWFARTATGTLVSPTKDAYAGPLSVATTLASATNQSTGAPSSSAPVLVVEGNGTQVYGEWLFQINLKNS